MESMNQNIVKLQYAVRGPLVTRALQLEAELAKVRVKLSTTHRVVTRPYCARAASGHRPEKVGIEVDRDCFDVAGYDVAEIYIYYATYYLILLFGSCKCYVRILLCCVSRS